MTSFPLAICLGVSGGNNSHNLCPFIEAFQALVFKGSKCTEVPDLSGPIRNQRYGGLLSSPI